MATVTYDHITKKFGDVSAVKDLNLQVRDEEFLAGNYTIKWLEKWLETQQGG
mgnify:CR=1 FL=1